MYVFCCFYLNIKLVSACSNDTPTWFLLLNSLLFLEASFCVIAWFVAQAKPSQVSGLGYSAASSFLKSKPPNYPLLQYRRLRVRVDQRTVYGKSDQALKHRYCHVAVSFRKKRYGNCLCLWQNSKAGRKSGCSTYV